MIPASEIVALKDLRFQLEGRERCGALPVLDTLQAIDAVQLNYMSVQWTQSVAEKYKFY